MRYSYLFCISCLDLELYLIEGSKYCSYHQPKPKKYVYVEDVTTSTPLLLVVDKEGNTKELTLLRIQVYRPTGTALIRYCTDIVPYQYCIGTVLVKVPVEVPYSIDSQVRLLLPSHRTGVCPWRQLVTQYSLANYKKIKPETCLRASVY